MHKFNKNFFKEISSESQAYILGFFYADGYNSGKQIEFDQLEQDIDILNQIKDALEADHTLMKIPKPNGKILYRLILSSVEMCKDLELLGAVKAKSLILKFPTYINKDLMPHFIRGYFDGDGCVWNGKRKKMIVKDSTKPSGFRERIVHNVKFNFTGCFEFINSLQDYLVDLGIVNKKTKLNFNQSEIHPDTVCSMEYSGRKQMRNLFEYMYNNATIYGLRKYNKFQEIFCALDEKSSKDTSLIAGTPEMAISSQASDNISVEGSSTIPEMGVESSDSKCEAPNM